MASVKIKPTVAFPVLVVEMSAAQLLQHQQDPDPTTKTFSDQVKRSGLKSSSVESHFAYIL